MDLNRLLKVLEVAKTLPGAVSMTEMAGLYKTIMMHLEAPDGAIAIDLGSHAGKSSITAIAALSEMGRKDYFHMVDPIYNLKNEEAWKDTIQGSADKMPWAHVHKPNFKEVIKTNIDKFSKLQYMLLGISANQLFDKIRKSPISYIFIDSDDHQPERVEEECNKIEDLILPGGLVFFHDYKNQYIGPHLAAEYLVETGKYEEIQIDWGFAKNFTNAHNLEKGNDTWQSYEDMSTIFVGCVKRIR